jgi:LPS-assembly lipoprotein
MSWFSLARRSVAALCLLSALTGCGFHPLYGETGEKGSIDPQLATVYVAQIKDRTGQEMTNNLRDALNPHAVKTEHAYQLEVGLVQHTYNLMGREDGSAARTDVVLEARWTLRRLSDNVVVLQGYSKSLTGYDVLTNEYANVVSGKSDLTRAVRDVSADIEGQLAQYFRQAA